MASESLAILAFASEVWKCQSAWWTSNRRLAFISADFTIARGLNSTMAGGTDRAGSSREAGPSSRNQSTHGTHRATVGAVTKSKCCRPKEKVDFIITTFFLLLRSTLRSARKLAASQISMASLVSLSGASLAQRFS